MNRLVASLTILAVGYLALPAAAEAAKGTLVKRQLPFGFPAPPGYRRTVYSTSDHSTQSFSNNRSYSMDHYNPYNPFSPFYPEPANEIQIINPPITSLNQFPLEIEIDDDIIPTTYRPIITTTNRPLPRVSTPIPIHYDNGPYQRPYPQYSNYYSPRSVYEPISTNRKIFNKPIHMHPYKPSNYNVREYPGYYRGSQYRAPEFRRPQVNYGYDYYYPQRTAASTNYNNNLFSKRLATPNNPSTSDAEKYIELKCPAQESFCPVKHVTRKWEICLNDSACKRDEKCCFDACIGKRVCKKIAI